MEFYHKILLFIALTFSFIISFISIPSIVKVAKMSGWLDKPDKRKIHKIPVPRLAGVAIFAAIIETILLFGFGLLGKEINYFLAALVFLFFLGIKDDILITAPLTKFTGQLVAVSIVVILGNVQITNLHGFFHIFHIPKWFGIPLTIFTFLVVINAFNFIDGIDGLSATIAIEVAATFAIWFYHRGIFQFAFLACALIGALLGYLPYNLSNKKYKIFMGDTGTMIIGLIISILAIEFNQFTLRFDDLKYFPAPSVSFGIMIVPFYDMLRVIYIRLLTGKKFYMADTNHIHHIFIKLGFNQTQTLIILALLNLIFIFLSFFLAKYFTIRRLLLVLLILISAIIYLPAHMLRKKEENEQ